VALPGAKAAMDRQNAPWPIASVVRLTDEHLRFAPGYTQ
jgi:hypothetical protein